MLLRAKSEEDIVIRKNNKGKIFKSVRGSYYRGVSKNGKQWQVIHSNNLQIGLTTREN